MRQKFLIMCCLILVGLSPLAPAKILFDSSRDSTVQGNQQDANYEIYIMNDDGSNVQNITNNPLLEESGRWSPDGKQIAFVRDMDNRLSHVMQTDIFIRDVKGTYEIRLTDHPAADGPDITWSPDGTRIAFVSLRSKGLNIHVIDVESKVVTQLTNNAEIGGSATSPDWSPDGDTIVYTQVIPGQGRTIYTMSADGKHQKPLVPVDVRLFRVSPRWSSSGDAILYAETEYEIVNNARKVAAARIFIHQLHNHHHKKITLPNKYLVSSVDWMGVGDEIILSARDTQTRKADIFRYHIGRQQLTNLTEGPGGGFNVDWIASASLNVMPTGKLALQWGKLKRGN